MYLTESAFEFKIFKKSQFFLLGMTVFRGVAVTAQDHEIPSGTQNSGPNLEAAANAIHYTIVM